MYSIMKAIFAYNFNRPRMKNIKTNSIAVTDNPPQFGGPTSAFTPYKVHDEVSLPGILSKRKDAFRKLKIMFGISEQVGIENYSTEATGTSQK